MKRLSSGMIVALFVAFFAFTAASVVSKNVFERLPHLEDEFAYLYQAKIFAGGHAWVPRNEPVKVFWQPFVIQPETSPDGVLKRFGKYTPGWPLLLSLGVLLGQPWYINAVLAMLSVALVYRLGREIFDEAVGVVAAILLAICPMALLLNGTLMSHVPAMFMGIVFVYGYWRVTRHGKRRYAWAALSGVALGWMVITRPMSALAIAIPVMLHALSRLLDAIFSKESKDATTRLLPTFTPLVVLSICTIAVSLLWPISNQIWTGDWRTDIYTMLWSYDTPGFGPDHGLMPGGHSWEYGFRNARADMLWYLRDLFGWTMTSQANQALSDNLGWGAGVGLSWLVILAGLIYGRKQEWIWLFFELFVAIVVAHMTYWIGSVVYGTAAYSLRYWYEATFGMCLVGAYGIVALIRQVGKSAQASEFVQAIFEVGAIFAVIEIVLGPRISQWLPSTTSALIAVFVVSIVIREGLSSLVKSRQKPVQVASRGSLSNAAVMTFNIGYLNGFSRESKTTVPIRASRLGRLIWGNIGYVLLIIAVGFSLIGYTPARFSESLAGWPNGLFRYNKVGQNQLDALAAARAKYGQPGQHVLILILSSPVPTVEDDWRDYGAAMAQTSPYLDSDIIVGRVFNKDDAPGIAQRFPGRLVLYQIGANLYPSADTAIKAAAASSPGTADDKASD